MDPSAPLIGILHTLSRAAQLRNDLAARLDLDARDGGACLPGGP